MELLESIHQKIISELDTRGKVSQFLLANATIRPTSSIYKNNQSPSLKSRAFRPSRPIKIFYIVFAVSIWAAIFYAIRVQKDINQGGLAIVMIASLIITINVLWQFFYDNTLNFSIQIDPLGITVDDQFLEWEKIRETSILNIPGRGRGLNYLIIILENDEYLSFELTNFYTSRGIVKSLSKYIEYFKAHAA
ncbi:MAG: hypothetical protein J0L83_00130 [Chitinophagales bacterium]|uniref:hypothetical protein n=1 Tax=Flavobacterium filum TaxID=370974 RepID=UPI001AC04EA0|nr:hypothetical protein [Flavobacterium filum]MBN8662952.1 hypothetical protein [Chitinophagales bacterium]